MAAIMAATTYNKRRKHCFNGFIVTLIGVVALISYCDAYEVYFPMSAIKFSIPINERSESIFSKIPIGQFQVLSAKNNSIIKDYRYSLEQNDLLTINGTTGEIFMKNNYNKKATNQKIMLTGISKNGFGELLIPIPHVSIDVFPTTEKEYCKNLENVCFWKEANYVIAEDLSTTDIDEPFQPRKIGTLNSRSAHYLCELVEPKYKLKTGNENFKLQNNFIYTKRKLNHESLNFTNVNMLTTLVTCSLKTSANIELTFQKLLNITILDLNDNAPELQNNQTYNFHLDQPHFKVNEQIGSKIIFIDKDAMFANAHQTFKIVNDTLDMMKSQCKTYESDHTGRRNTIISCQIIFARNGILSESPYCFFLEANDKILENEKEVLKSTRAHICLHTNIEKIHESDRPMALALRSNQQRKFKNVINSEDDLRQPNSNYGQLITPDIVNYPKDVYVYRQASVFYRITQPTDFLHYLEKPRLKFNILGDRTGAFGITSTGGILYVKDNGALMHAAQDSYALNITWQDQIQHSHMIQVHLLPDRPDNISCEFKIKSRSQTCAQVKFKQQCEKFCGLGTNGGACSWRGSNAGFFGRNYASCVPNPQFCPDRICDPLEELNTFLCPQDCTPSNKIMGPHSANDNKRGILSASGTCTCEDNGKCGCAPIDDEEPKWKRKRKNETKSVPNVPSLLNVHEIEKINDEEPNLNNSKAAERILNVGGFVCDKSCLIIAATCPFVFIFLIICLIFSRRNLKRRKTGKDIQHKGVTQTISGDGFGECDIRNGDLPLMQLESGFKFEPSDDKWEYDRSKLVLDAVLGEGEFGKVTKAYANDIAGIPGVTTVAVKMLKNGANSVEYMSLLSEFQLLQEVSHTNVIKLLGACTKDGPPMIIIEYAKYGSLRSYLRLSRKIECSGVDFTDGVEPVTVKQILSFAWQICKGMAYLTEIKLVHRDLAARNVLLADGKICKVSDFGLTRDVYEDDAYLKRSRDRVPVKWMAPESLADHVYTTKSDVWAFGVLCWELITLGASPYPGVPPQNLYHLLKSGYRMERPENCSEDIYSIVRSCWTDEPNARPSFKYLASQFEKLLGNNAKYIEIETNAVSNPLYCSESSTKSIDENGSQSDLTKLSNDFGEPDNLDHFWRPPSMNYDTQEANNSREFSSTFSAEFLPPPGYDLPRPLIEASTTEQILRYENDLRFPLNIRKSVCNDINCANGAPHYSVPVKRGRSYVDMSKKNLIPDNLDSSDFEKHLSKTISFRFSSQLNLNETPETDVEA